jgi:hypothetical protein
MWASTRRRHGVDVWVADMWVASSRMTGDVSG